ncbi:MAG: zinc-ribbon domain-containing protein [Dehalococcoidales bacterium]
MVFLFGKKDYYDPLGYINMMCPKCEEQRIFAVKQERKRLTVYFVPTFQFSSRQVVVCEHCGETLQVDDELKKKVAQNMISREQLETLLRRGELDHLLGIAPSRAKRTAKIVCENCGSRNDKGMRFCPQCGNKL